MYNVGRLGFFERAQPSYCFGRNWRVPIFSATKTLAHLGKKIFFTDIDWKNRQSSSAKKDDRSRSKKEASPHDADRTFPYRHHAYFIKGLNRKLNSRHRSWSRPTDIFQPTLRNIFYKRWSIIFFYGRGCFFVRCGRKNLQCRSTRFFRSSSTEVVFWPTPPCSHLLGQENISPARQKNVIHQYW